MSLPSIPSHSVHSGPSALSLFFPVSNNQQLTTKHSALAPVTDPDDFLAELDALSIRNFPPSKEEDWERRSEQLRKQEWVTAAPGAPLQFAEDVPEDAPDLPEFTSPVVTGAVKLIMSI